MKNVELDQRLLSSFASALARRIGGSGAHVQSPESISLPKEGRTDLLLQGSHGEILVSLHRGGVEADRRDFLLLVRVFDSVFPAFRVSSPAGNEMHFESRFCFEILSEVSGKILFSCDFQGQFSSAELHFMDWFILSQEFLSIPLLAIKNGERNFQLVLNAHFLGRSYLINPLGPTHGGGGLYQVIRECDAVGVGLPGPQSQSSSDHSHHPYYLHLGQVRISIVELGALVSGTPLVLNLPSTISALSSDMLPSVQTVSCNDGILADF